MRKKRIERKPPSMDSIRDVGFSAVADAHDPTQAHQRAHQ